MKSKFGRIWKSNTLDIGFAFDQKALSNVQHQKILKSNYYLNGLEKRESART